MRSRNLLLVAPSRIDGRGVFARRDIPEGAHIGTYRGKPARRNGKYVLWVEDGEETLARSGTAPLKFLNHATEPNAYFDGFELYAQVDIEEGEEITFHYGEEWHGA